ncbi:MAG: RnfABCDGE type electron transport complex subunit D [Methylocystaceae bacterium]|nr:RnfABCDGE type electron transport complex subunit D [Methylocystaceae bacterium]
MKQLPLVAGPFIHKGNTVQKTMLLVILALVPATAYGIYLFGLPALYLFATTIAACVLIEMACLKLAGKKVKPFIFDGSAVLTGWLLAMTLPPWAPWWIGVVGAILAIAIGKHVFGGLGQNLFNPAMVARVALLISFPVEMTKFTHPTPLFSEKSPDAAAATDVTFGQASTIDGVSSASTLGHIKTEVSLGHSAQDLIANGFDLITQSLGNVPGSLGETSAISILIGGLFLLAMRVISWHIPLSMIVGVGLFAQIFHTIDPSKYAGADVHILGGATLLGAFFIATDLVTSPVSKTAQIIFGFAIGVLVYIIRTWGGYPEGMAFAVLLMNAVTPLLDRYIKPRVYGRDRKGTPLEFGEKKS